MAQCSFKRTKINEKNEEDIIECQFNDNNLTDYKGEKYCEFHLPFDGLSHLPFHVGAVQ